MYVRLLRSIQRFLPCFLQPASVWFLTFGFLSLETGRRDIYLTNSTTFSLNARRGALRSIQNGHERQPFSLEVQAQCAEWGAVVRFLGKIWSSLLSSNFRPAWGQVPRDPTLIHAHKHMLLILRNVANEGRQSTSTTSIGYVKRAGNEPADALLVYRWLQVPPNRAYDLLLAPMVKTAFFIRPAE
jgi:hypothetical protein